MCYLLWELTVQGAVPLEEVREIFAWVEDDCELRITSLQAEPGSPAEETPVSAPRACPLETGMVQQANRRQPRKAQSAALIGSVALGQTVVTPRSSPKRALSAWASTKSMR